VLAGDDLPFALSTPRLKSDSLFHLQSPFDDEVVDELLRLKTVPRSRGDIKEMLKAPEALELYTRWLWLGEKMPGVKFRDPSADSDD